MFRTKRLNSERTGRYASAANFVEIYNREMRSLYMLSILLTGDPEKAEQCFARGLEDCLSGIDVSIEWARLWARRVIIKHAIMLVKPVPEHPVRQSLPDLHWNSKPKTDNLTDALFTLTTFDRFVFVMSLLERQSDGDCSVLLSCKRRDVELARARALRSLAGSDGSSDAFKDALRA